MNGTPKVEDYDLKKLPVTKLDAARRQIETAICLWFDEGDPVSIHTLIAAAHGILRDINKKLGGPPMLSEPSQFIRPGKEKEVRRIMRAAANFFKHANTDPKGTHFFSARANEGFLIESCQVYAELAHERRPLMRLFTHYFKIHEPDLFLPDPAADPIPDTVLKEIRTLSKRQFFFDLLPSLMRIPTSEGRQ
jgi:hypothetical protein